jgi:DNA-binding transcriptional LysR family regulator
VRGLLGATGPADGSAADPRYLDVWVPACRRKPLPIETYRHAFAYIFEGSGTFRDASKPFGVLTEQGTPDNELVIREIPDPSPLTEGRDFGVLSPGTWRVSDNAAKHALIIAGVGWGSLPLWLVDRDPAEGRLVRIAAAEFGERGETLVGAYLAHRTDQPLGPAARLVRQALLRYVDGSSATEPELRRN